MGIALFLQLTHFRNLNPKLKEQDVKADMPILQPSPATIGQCVAALQQDALIGLPTETVYGLAANALSEAALAKIYEAKARPKFNPLICHITDIDAAVKLGDLNADAHILAAAFWPGALTLVVPRLPDCPVALLASAGLPTLALRVPSHPLMQQILQKFAAPIAAPSANPSGRLSPTTARHVADLLPKLPVLDGGDCAIGLESTIIGCIDENPILLRAGGVARDDIENVLQKKLRTIKNQQSEQALLAPGQLAQHYAPRCTLHINCRAVGDKIWLGFGAQDSKADANLSASGNLTQAAANLFAMLHQLDNEAVKQGRDLAVSPIPHIGLGEAINDRLERAAQKC